MHNIFDQTYVDIGMDVLTQAIVQEGTILQE